MFTACTTIDIGISSFVFCFTAFYLLHYVCLSHDLLKYKTCHSQNKNANHGFYLVCYRLVTFDMQRT